MDRIAEICCRFGAAKLSLFGSILRDDFHAGSDMDILVEFAPTTRIGLIGVAKMEGELSEAIGRRVDLRSAGDLSRCFRNEVVAGAGCCMPRDTAVVLREDRIRLTHMVESARRAVRIPSGLTAALLAADEVRLLAVIKSIEVIGEAWTKVSNTTRRRLPAIDWEGVWQMRHRLIHGYDTIDPARVWDAHSIDVPPLIGEIDRALAHWPDTGPLKRRQPPTCCVDGRECGCTANLTRCSPPTVSAIGLMPFRSDDAVTTVRFSPAAPQPKFPQGCLHEPVKNSRRNRSYGVCGTSRHPRTAFP